MVMRGKSMRGVLPISTTLITITDIIHHMGMAAVMVGMGIHRVFIIQVGMGNRLIPMRINPDTIPFANIIVVVRGNIIMVIETRGTLDLYIILVTLIVLTTHITRRYPNTIIPTTMTTLVSVISMKRMTTIVHIFTIAKIWKDSSKMVKMSI